MILLFQVKHYVIKQILLAIIYNQTLQHWNSETGNVNDVAIEK